VIGRVARLGIERFGPLEDENQNRLIARQRVGGGGERKKSGAFQQMGKDRDSVDDALVILSFICEPLKKLFTGYSDSSLTLPQKRIRLFKTVAHTP